MNKFYKPYNNFLKWLLFFLLPIQFILIKTDEFKNSSLINLYTTNYNYISEFRKNIFSKFSFSVGDLIYLLIVILVVTAIYKNRLYYLNYKSRFFIDLFSVISAVSIVFQISWGLNYHSQSLESKLNIEEPYSDHDLEKVVSFLIYKTTKLHSELSKNDTLPITFPFNKKQARLLLADKKNNIVKNSIWSTLLSYTGYAGYLNPFTLEAQVNEKIPMISYLTTIAHEQSHQNGVARENESNYWAYKKTSNNKNPYIKYAGYSFALRYCMSDLFKKNPKKFKLLSKNINTGIKKNLNDINKFWDKYQNPFEPIFKRSYDSFLKLNNQKRGISSYNEMVTLVIFDFKNDIE